tara:strand:+ start:1519 stop:3858 length:2340 start_codon:yes stop_codon:yes gene_type:complete
VSEKALSALLTPDTDTNLDRSSSISYSADGTILAVAYEKEVYLYHSITRNELEISPLILPNMGNDIITSVEFTSDSSNLGDGYLLVGRESIQANTPAISIYDLSTNWGHSYVDDGTDVTSIVSMENGQSFAYATKMADGSEYILQFSYTNLDEPIRSIKTNHESKITCLDYDDDRDIFISASNGKIVLDLANGQAVEYSEPGIPIFDCKFSKNGEYAWSSDGDGIKIRDSNHDFLQSLTLPNSINAEKLIFDKTENILHVLTNEAGNSLSTYEANGTWSKIDDLVFGHEVIDLDVNSNNGEIATSTYSKYLAIYSHNWKDPRISESPNNDLDRDGIDDQDDDDRDGDGILNQFDTVCESTTPCNLVSDMSFVRNIDIQINERSLTITESIFFSTQFSESLRLIVAESIDEDGYIEPDERTIMNYAFCSKINEDILSDTWYGLITFDNNSLIAGKDSVQFLCNGLTNLAHDSKERIKFEWSISYELVNDNNFNYTLTFSSPPELGYGMPTNLVHSFPIMLKVTDPQIKSYSIENWFNDAGSFNLEFVGEEEKSTIEINTLIKYLKYTSYVLFTVAAIIISGLLILRYKNRFKIEDYSTNKKTPPKSTNKKTPPTSKRTKKDDDKSYSYYNPGRRDQGDWNYGDDGGYYYSESYTDYKEASNSVKKPKVRKIKVDSVVIDKKEEKPSRRRIVRKKNQSQKEKSEAVAELSTDDVKSNLHNDVITEESTSEPEDINQEMSEEKMIEKLGLGVTVDGSEQKEEIKLEGSEDEMMDKALDKFFK